MYVKPASVLKFLKKSSDTRLILLLEARSLKAPLIHWFSLCVLGYFCLSFFVPPPCPISSHHPSFSVCVLPFRQHSYTLHATLIFKALSWLIYMSPIELQASPMGVDQETLFVSDDSPVPDQVW